MDISTYRKMWNSALPKLTPHKGKVIVTSTPIGADFTPVEFPETREVKSVLIGNEFLSEPKGGPKNKPVFINSSKEFFDVFGKPDSLYEKQSIGRGIRKTEITRVVSDLDPYGEEDWRN